MNVNVTCVFLLELEALVQNCFQIPTPLTTLFTTTPLTPQLTPQIIFLQNFPRLSDPRPFVQIVKSNSII